MEILKQIVSERGLPLDMYYEITRFVEYCPNCKVYRAECFIHKIRRPGYALPSFQIACDYCRFDNVCLVKQKTGWVNRGLFLDFCRLQNKTIIGMHACGRGPENSNMKYTYEISGREEYLGFLNTYYDDNKELVNAKYGPQLSYVSRQWEFLEDAIIRFAVAVLIPILQNRR